VNTTSSYCSIHRLKSQSLRYNHLRVIFYGVKADESSNIWCIAIIIQQESPFTLFYYWVMTGPKVAGNKKEMPRNARYQSFEADTQSQHKRKGLGRKIDLIEGIEYVLQSLFLGPRVLQESETSSSLEEIHDDTISPCVLNRLPLELLICIMKYLPPESVMAFSLTCKNSLRSLGTQQVARIRHRTNKLALVNLLAADLPDQVACWHCIRLHKIENFRRYTHSSYWTSNHSRLDCFRKYSHLLFPSCVDRGRDAVHDGIGDNFSTTTFQMVMKLYGQQSAYAWLLDTMSAPASIKESHHYVMLYTDECCIHQGRLMQRLRRVYFPRERSYFNRRR
jgi:hypothetical protein